MVPEQMSEPFPPEKIRDICPGTCSIQGMGLIENFVTLWVVIDPIGTIPVFIAVTAGMSAAARRSTALAATLVSVDVALM